MSAPAKKDSPEISVGHSAIQHLVRTLTVVEDPRGRQGRLHAFSDVLVILVLAVLCRCDNAEAVEEWGNKEQAWLRKFIPLRNGVPSQDTYLRALACLRTEAFHAVFAEWVRTVFPNVGTRGQIALDGKTVRGAKRMKGDPSRVHLVSAFDCDMGVVLAQLKTAEDSNEIKTLPELLSSLDLRGALVSIDAIGAQVEITKVIVDGGGDYLIGLKDNQPTFRRETQDLFDELSSARHRTVDEAFLPQLECDEQTDAGHGRIEIRRAAVCHDFVNFVPSASRFANVQTLIEIQSERTFKTTGEVTRETRHYFSSRKLSAKDANDAVRGHWAIENKVHWCLDVSFDEDRCRVHTENAATNFAVIRRFALNVIRAFTGDKLSVPRRRQKCDYFPKYREKLLGIS
jgi:predicted transposase YbfD/YdcC